MVVIFSFFNWDRDSGLLLSRRSSPYSELALCFGRDRSIRLLSISPFPNMFFGGAWGV